VWNVVFALVSRDLEFLKGFFIAGLESGYG